jgi:hypothetical protein
MADVQDGAGSANQTQTTTQTQTQTQTPPPGGNTVPESFVNADGTLKEGWQNSNLIPDDFRGRKVYGMVGNSVPELLRHIGHQDIAISKQGKGIFVPGPEATQTEKDLFFKAIGRPDKPESYKFETPKGMEKYYEDTAIMDSAKAAFHKVGLNQQQFEAVLAFDALRMSEAVKDMQTDPMPYFEELFPLVQPILAQKAAEDLHAKWGDAFDARLHLANRAIAEFTAEGPERDALLARIGNDPLVADFLATIMQKHFSEASGVDTSGGTPPAPALNLDQRITQINEQLTENLKRTNRTKYDSLLEERSKLYSMRYKDNTGTGNS